MSTSVSPTQTKTILPKTVLQLKSDEKPPRLIRSSSIDKIKRFNTFICSQQYYILPAILNWAKSSQNGGLPSSTERLILIFKSLIINSVFYKYFLNGLKNVTPSSAHTQNVSKKLDTVTIDDIQLVIANFYNKYTSCFESTFLIKTGLYVGTFVIFGQILISIYLLAFVVVPLGLMFLVACLSVCAHLSHSITVFYNKQSDIRHKVMKCY